MTERVKLVASGCGKAGGLFVMKALADPEVEIVGILEAETSNLVNMRLDGVFVSGDPEIIGKADVVVEFSTKSAVLEHASIVAALGPSGPSWLICTTGIEEDPEAMAQLQKVAEETFVMLAPNATLGMNVMFVFVPLMLNVLGLAGWKAVGHEVHHDRKDPTKPSGTAVALDKRAQKVAGIEIPFSWSRILDVVGDHRTIMLVRLAKG